MDGFRKSLLGIYAVVVYLIYVLTFYAVYIGLLRLFETGCKLH